MRNNNKVEFFGYEGKQTYENASSGMRTIEMDFELLPKIRQFVLDVMKEEKFVATHIINGFRETNSGNFSFKCGGGYCISDDLLNGNGSGIVGNTFQKFLDYDKDRTFKNLEKLNDYIDTYKTQIKYSFPNAERFEGYNKEYELPEKKESELKLEKLLLETKEITINTIKEELVENKFNRFELNDMTDKNSISIFLEDKDHSIERKVNLTLLSDDPNRIYNVLTEEEKQEVLGDKNESVNDVYILANIDEARKEVINKVKENIKTDDESFEFLNKYDLKNIEKEINIEIAENKKELEKFNHLDKIKEKTADKEF